MPDFGSTETVNTSNRQEAARRLEKTLSTIRRALDPTEEMWIKDVIEGLRNVDTTPTD